MSKHPQSTIPGLGANQRIVVSQPLSPKLVDEFGERVVAMKNMRGWTSVAHNHLVCDYVRSLTSGDGTAPAELCDFTRVLVGEAFLLFCAQRHIDFTVEEHEHELALAG